MLSVNDVAARLRRLNQLSLGLAKEIVIWKAGDDPLLFLERNEFLKGLQGGLAGIEVARVVMAKAKQRLEKGER